MRGTGFEVIIVDDEASVRKGLERLLRAAGYSVCTFDSSASFLNHAPLDAGPCCLILDVKMPGLNGIDLYQQLVAQQCDIPVVFLTGHGDIPMSVRAIKAGAQDFLTKPVSEEDLLAAVESALERHCGMLEACSRNVQVHACLETLTPRELEVLRCMISGAPSKQIGAFLGIAEKTVKVHRGRVKGKLGVASMAELVRLCGSVGITPTSIE